MVGTAGTASIAMHFPLEPIYKTPSVSESTFRLWLHLQTLVTPSIAHNIDCSPAERLLTAFAPNIHDNVVMRLSSIGGTSVSVQAYRKHRRSFCTGLIMRPVRAPEHVFHYRAK